MGDMLKVSLLGEQVIADDQTGIILARSSRGIALVAFLVCHAGTAQPRQRIAGLLWPESSDAQALTNLRRELHHLRQVLGDDPSLVVTPRDLCWQDAPTCRVDVRFFAAERQAALAAADAGDAAGVARHGGAAIDAYRGELLAGAYDDWLLAARSELEHQCTSLCDLVAAARASTGDLAGAVAAARRRAQLQPLEETGYRTLMQLQADSGDRAGAVSTYHRCASVLERELGVQPDAATQAAFRRLMAGARPAQVASPPRRSSPAAAALVGRSAELDLLRDAWRAAAAGRPGLALVRGGAGVGKTRLVTEIGELARAHGAAVASTQCFGASARLALAPVADWLRSPPVQAAVTTLDPAWRAEVGRLVPAGGIKGDGGEGSHGSDGADGVSGRTVAEAWQRHRFFEGLARALLAVDRPLLLVLDNMQWCDQETLSFITFCLGLAAPDSGASLLVAATLRDDYIDADPEHARWTMRMRATGLLTELSLGPLDATGTAALAAAISGQPLAEADAALLHATTGGFPLYVIEAVRGAASGPREPGTPGDLAAVLRKRLEQATPAAVEVAGLAAAVGTNFSLDLLTEASDLDSGVVVGAVDELWQRRIVGELGDGYDFSHDLLRDAAYQQVSPPKRWLLHRRVAQALELLHAGDPDQVASQLADQYARGGRGERAVAFYRRAAKVAADRFAHAEAIRLHRKALEIIAGLPPGPDRDRQELAVLEAIAAPLNARHGYASPELQQVLERSITLAETLGRTAELVTGLVALWTSRIVQGRLADSYRVGARALRLADSAELSGLAHFAVGGSALSLGRPAEGVRQLELAASPVSGAIWLSVGTRPDVHATAWSAHGHWLLGHDDRALAASRESIDLARSIDDTFNLAVALAYSSITHQMRGDLPALRSDVDELCELCRRYEFAYYGEWALILEAWARADDSGIEQARLGIGNLRAQGAFVRMPYWLSLLADLLVRAGNRDQAVATLDAAIAACRARDDLWWLPEVMRRRAAHEAGDAATTRLRQAAALAAAHGSTGLVRRCERDLRARGVRGVRGVRTQP